jgi:hypothetical protein
MPDEPREDAARRLDYVQHPVDARRGAKKYAEAEPLLLKGYEGMKTCEETIPPQASTHLPEALDRLIELYTATNQPDEAKKWQAERAKYPDPTLPPDEKK